MSGIVFSAAKYLAKRALVEDPDSADVTIPDDDDLDSSNPVTEEIFSSWALFILLFLLIAALWSSYFLQQKRIQAVHETVLSIFYGMVIGLALRVSPGHYIQDSVTFNSSYFFNILLPPIILNSGYELHQANFFKNFGSILTFAIPGTFISAVVLGAILYIWTKLGLESINISFVDALSVGATLSATDPVTILSIFNAYKVDPKLYTIIFGESLLNDAISIVMFETCQQFHDKEAHFSSFFEGAGLFLMIFTISLLIGVVIGIIVALILKHSHIRRYPQIESCFVLLIAYESYFFSNGCHMSGIVSLLFCGITLKHYAYYNMSRRTQISTKYIFQILARLSENFIFVYLGLALFTEVELVYKPGLIIVTTISICIARWCAVFPLSRIVNWVYRKRANNPNLPDEIPYQYQMMTFWAGLRGAVGVALAMGLQGEFKSTLLATVLVVVVLTVILFGGTTAGMLEVLNIKTGCIDEDESDDEFDIETSSIRQQQQRQAHNDIALANRVGVSVTGNRVAQPYSDSNGAARSRQSPNFNGSADFLKDEDIPEDLNDIPPLVPNSSSSQAQLVGSSEALAGGSFVGTVQNILHDDRSKWFQNFDEQVLKPVLLDSSNGIRNSRDGHENV
jgi:sodium/hydrogen exchanger-like protein 6/7